MIYAHTVQKIVESSADQAALRYDNEFRRWRQRDPFGFPLQHNNVELHQEAVVLGLEFKLKNKNQPFRSTIKHKNFFAYNNNERQCFPPHSRLLTVCGKKTTANYAPNLNQAQKEVPTPPPTCCKPVASTK